MVANFSFIPQQRRWQLRSDTCDKGDTKLHGESRMAATCNLQSIFS